MREFSVGANPTPCPSRMIDPNNITNYNLTKDELEEHILWWILAAGKNGMTAAKSLDKLLKLKPIHNSPFQFIRAYLNTADLALSMKNCGIGCYNIKANTFREIAFSQINLKTCSVSELEKIKGIGQKTARCFLIHSRPNQQLAGLDRHILHFLKDKGYNVPSSTPTGKRYAQIEQYFISEVKKTSKTISELDLEIWKHYRNKKL